MAMTNEEYWAARIAELEKKWNRKSQEELEKELARYYNQALKRIQKDIEALYGRFAKDNGLSYADAVKTLTKSEYNAWRMDMEDYLKQYKSTGDKAILKELNILSMKSRISRLDKLYSETLTHLADLSGKTETATDNFHTEAYKDFYYHGIYEIGKKIGFTLPVSVVDDKDILQILRMPWSGKNYSQRIWKNNAKLSRTLKQTITQALHRGTDTETLSRLVSQKMSTGLSNARRLVRTELNFAENHAALDSIRDSGMKYYRFIATLDRRTSTQCREHDGHVYKVEDYSPGTNAPPLHPNCRSTISGSLKGPGGIKNGTRIAKAGNGKTYHIPADMRYEDWKNVYVDKTESITEWKKQRKDDTLKLPGIPNNWQRIIGQHDPDDDIKHSNPNYSSDYSYQINCQRCVQTYELRRRGYDVVAMPKPAVGQTNLVIWGSECFAQPLPGENISDAASKMFTYWQTEAKVKKELANAPDGARYVIYVKWKGRNTGAHVFIAQKESGVIRYLDPQVGDSNVEWYFQQGRKGEFGFCRIDDKPLISDDSILSATAQSR